MEPTELSPWQARTAIEWFELSQEEPRTEPDLSAEDRKILECWLIVVEGRADAVPPLGRTPWDGLISDPAKSDECVANAIRLCLARAIGERTERKVNGEPTVGIPNVAAQFVAAWGKDIIPYHAGSSDSALLTDLDVGSLYYRKRELGKSPTLSLPEVRVAIAWSRWMSAVGTEEPNKEDRDLAREFELHFAAGECMAAPSSHLDRILMWFHLVPEELGLMGPSDIELARRLHEVLDGELMTLSRLWSAS